MTTNEQSAKHVPQYGLNFSQDGYERNPYHIACPVCHASAGEYCSPAHRSDLGAGYVDAVGFVAHGDRCDAAYLEADCDECMERYGTARSAQTLADVERKQREREAENEARIAWQTAGGKPWEFPGVAKEA